jgi:hypothetical protein
MKRQASTPGESKCRAKHNNHTHYLVDKYANMNIIEKEA